MIVFEGCRNTGKTFLSELVSISLDIPRFQYDFIGTFKSFKIIDHDPISQHDFSVGKETMIMQLNKENLLPANMIHDRGFLTVLAWGISQKRISKEQAVSQLHYLKESGLLKRIQVIYIEGKNPSTSTRVKDIWDETEKNNLEKEAYDFIIGKLAEISYDIIDFSIYRFKNNFDDNSSKTMLDYVRNIISQNH